MKRKILVLEDEENIRSFLVLNLKRSGYEVIEAETGERALEKYHENQDIAVAVLDVMLPGIDGYEVCRAMRGAGYQAGVIMLTARTQEADKVTGLMNGADDMSPSRFRWSNWSPVWTRCSVAFPATASPMRRSSSPGRSN